MIVLIQLLALAASFGTGMYIGWLLTRTWATTAMAWSQKRMQNKVRYWQAEARRAQDTVRQLTGLPQAERQPD